MVNQGTQRMKSLVTKRDLTPFFSFCPRVSVAKSTPLNRSNTFCERLDGKIAGRVRGDDRPPKLSKKNREMHKSMGPQNLSAVGCAKVSLCNDATTSLLVTQRAPQIYPDPQSPTIEFEELKNVPNDSPREQA